MAEVGAKGAEFIDTDGVKMKWDPERRAYFPAQAMDDAFMSQYTIAYGSSGSGDTDGRACVRAGVWRRSGGTAFLA